MAMSPRLLRPRATGYDPAAQVYFNAVALADGEQLEPAVKKAINDFVVGCKRDGIWSSIKASCLLMGARTLSGALTPLVGTAPTNNNFVSGDYNRKTGLVGNGSTKYLNANRNNNADPQDSNHNAVYSVGTPDITTGRVYIGSNGIGTAGANNLFATQTTGVVSGFSRGTSSAVVSGSGNQSGTGFKGHSRSASGTANLRVNGNSYSGSSTSTTPTNENVLVFARTASAPALYFDQSIAFYSIGESLDLALFDTRVSDLYTAIGAAIP